MLYSQPQRLPLNASRPLRLLDARPSADLARFCKFSTPRSLVMSTPQPVSPPACAPVPAQKDIVLGGILLLAAFLLFWSLDGRLLWQDEAETALLGRNILRFGVPLADDGTNLVAQEAGREIIDSSFLPHYLWRWSPWVQFYLASAGLAVFGQTTLAARLPFVLLGFLTIPLTYLLARRAFGSVAVARWSALFLTTSVPFLLHARQARWYAPAYFLVACLLLALLALTQGRRFSRLAFLASALFLFCTNYFIAIGLFLAVLLAAPLLQPRRAFLVELVKTYAILALLTAPGVWFFGILDKGGTGLEMDDILDFGRSYLGSLFTFLLPLSVLALAFLPMPARTSWSQPGSLRTTLFLCLVLVLYLAYLCLAPWVMFRYLTVLLPVTTLLMALGVARVWAWSRWAGALLVLTVVGTNALHLVPLGLYKYPGTRCNDSFSVSGPVSSPLVAYLIELTQPIAGPEAAVCDYLREHGQPNDVILATYGDLVFQFYLNRKVVGGLQGRDLPLDPDWVVRRRFVLVSRNEERKDGWVFDFLGEHLDASRYDRIEVGEELCLEHNPDPLFHVFRQPPAEMGPVILLRRKR